MTEREKMLHAKSYIDMLAEGRSPLSGAELPLDSTLADARIVRCLFYVSELIERLAVACDEDGYLLSGGRPKRVRRKDVATLITPKLLAQVNLSTEPMTVTAFAEHIASTLSESVGQKVPIPVVWITNWLAETGYLRIVERTAAGNGRTEKIATTLGEQNGISTKEDRFDDQPIHKNFYSMRAQQLIIDHLPEILAAHQ